MKAITKHLLPRYTWFMLWYKQWFKNAEGIKGFAAQVMNWLMQSTMALAEKLKNQNKKLAEAIKTTKAKLAKWYEHPTINADEWDEIKGKVKKLGFWIVVLIITEAACNYFAVETLMEGKGWFWITVRALVAIGITGGCLYLFERWMAAVINKPAYKQEEAPKRNWIEIAILTCICVGVEIAFYYLCKRRGIVLEGNSGDETANNFLIIFGMMLPIFIGYLAYERSRYTSPYNNTLRIAKAEKAVAQMESKIATNNQKMEDHFKREVENSWGLLQEYKVYKENYNLNKGIEKENIAGHFCETHDSFEKEAVQRYQKEVLHQTPIQPTLVIAKEQMNGHSKQLPQNIINR